MKLQISRCKLKGKKVEKTRLQTEPEILLSTETGERQGAEEGSLG
jgi:hypothetical protein